MSKFSTGMVETQDIQFTINKWTQSWLEDDARLGAFSRDRFQFKEQDRIEYLGKLRTFVTDILERKLVDDNYPVTFTYKVPSNWWQQLKIERLPDWFVERYPVQFTSKTIKRTVNITRKATYPMADVVVPKSIGTLVIKDIVSNLNFYEKD
jgi:hypothetical protein